MHLSLFPRWLMTILILTFIVLVAGGYWFYQTQEQQLRHHEEDALQAIGQLKGGEIVAWRAERLGDAAILTESPFFNEGISRWITDPQTDVTADLLDRFRSIQAHYHYSNIMLVDVDGQMLLSLSEDPTNITHDSASRESWPLMTMKDCGLI